MHLPFWLTTALLFPVLLYQGRRARKNTPRLPEAQGSPSGHYGEGTPDLRLLVIGESTAADVVLLSMGVNDTTGFTPRGRFRSQLLALRDGLAPRYPGPGMRWIGLSRWMLHKQAMHRMPKPSIRCSIVKGDGGRVSLQRL